MTESEKAAQQSQDIDNLYNQLEATMIKVKNNNELKRSMSSLSSNSTISSSSSNSTNDSIDNDDMDENNNYISATQCLCKYWLVSIDSEHCGLCDQVIPIVQQHQQNRLDNKAKIKNLKAQLDEKQSLTKLYGRDVNTLQTEYTKRQLSVIDMTNKIQSLNQDIEIVQLKHKDEIAHTIAIEQSKKLVENELHDLTQKLFEEANNMVLAEKQEKLAIQLEHDKVNDQLQRAESELSGVQVELQELRKDMTEKDQDANPQQQLNLTSSFSSFLTTHENYLLRAQLDMSTLLLDQSQPIEINSDYHQQVHDDALLTEFQQFSNSIKSVGLSKMCSLPFMKTCMKTDIEPCLRFGPTPKISTKKIADAILVKTCFVEACPPGFVQEKLKTPTKVEVKTRLWDRFSSVNNTTTTHGELPQFLGCQACGRTIGLNEKNCWRFRISYFDEWSIIDRYCHDRIASVIEFYTFLRRLKVGAYKDLEIFQVYQECSRLRLQMFLSRMGALPTLLDEFGLDSSKIGSSSTGLSP